MLALRRAAAGVFRTTVRPFAVNPTNNIELLLPFIVCPLSKGPLRFIESRQELVSDTLGVAYPIVDGVPNLIPSSGRILSDEDWQTSWAKEAGLKRPGEGNP